MDQFFKIPQPFRNKIVGAPIVGLCCLLVGLLTWDLLSLALGSVIAAWCVWRSIFYYRKALFKEYDTFDGTCIWINRRRLRSQLEARFMSEDGEERSLWLRKSAPVRVGNQYRIYFSREEHPKTDSHYLSVAMASADVLGIELISPPS